MTVQAVHWYEGMFLRPQHFQVAERHYVEMAGRGAKWNLHYDWGVRSIDLDPDALANYRLLVRSLQGRLHDGTLVSIPEDGALPALDQKEAFRQESTITVYLAVPILQVARANSAPKDAPNGARFLVDTLRLEDENTGTNPQPVDVRLLNLSLLLSTQDHSGYEVLPIARIQRADRAEASPQLDETYIPPLLSCDAWRFLSTEILSPIWDRLGKKIDLLGSQVASAGMTFDSRAQGERLVIEQLRVLNEASTVLGVLAFVNGIHPLSVFTELCRLVGKLAIFAPARRPPELPKYDHDDLGPCFWRLKHHIDALLDTVVEPEYRERRFTGAGLRMQVALEPGWLESGWEMFVGVESPLPAGQCERLLSGRLDMKIGSSDRADDIFRLGQAGLRFNHVPHPPRSLPVRDDLIYFQVDRQSQAAEWESVKRSLALAIRLNENLIVSSIQDRQSISIKHDGQTTTLSFTLFVVPMEQV